MPLKAKCIDRTNIKGSKEEIVVEAKLTELVPLDRDPENKKPHCWYKTHLWHIYRLLCLIHY